MELANRDDDSIQSHWERDLRSLLFARQRCDVIELGCLINFETQDNEIEQWTSGAGTGMVSLTLGTLRSVAQEAQTEGQIIATDLGQSFTR